MAILPPLTDNPRLEGGWLFRALRTIRFSTSAGWGRLPNYSGLAGATTMLLRAARLSSRVLSAASNAILFSWRELPHSIPYGSSLNCAGKRVCLFSHFDKDNKLDDHVVNYLMSLRETGLDIVLITSCPSLEADNMSKAKQFCSTIIIRANRGYDFAGWALAIKTLNGIDAAQQIVFANDSVYGPISPLRPIFSEMTKRGAHVWGITQSQQLRWHIQSYFLVFERKAIASPAFQAFWSGIRSLRKWDVTKQYETKLASFFSDRGLHVGSYVAPNPGNANPTLTTWRETIAKGSPFIKVQLLRENPLDVDITGWRDAASSGGYDASLIEKHLERVVHTTATREHTSNIATESDLYIPHDPTHRVRDIYAFAKS